MNLRQEVNDTVHGAIAAACTLNRTLKVKCRLLLKHSAWSLRPMIKLHARVVLLRSEGLGST